MLWVLICTVHFIICTYVTYAFQRDSTVYSCLYFNELFARNRRGIWSLSDCNVIWTHKHLVHNRTFNQTFSQTGQMTELCYEYLSVLATQFTTQYSQHSSIISPVWLNGWVFVYQLSGCKFKYCCSHLNFRHCVCFKQGVLWHSGNYRVYIHFERRTRHDKNMQSNAQYT